MNGTGVKIKQIPWFVLPSVQIFSPAILKYGWWRNNGRG